MAGPNCIVLMLILYGIWNPVVSFVLDGLGGDHNQKDCNTIPAYNELVNLRRHDECWSINSVFRHLHEIGDKTCEENAIHDLEGHFKSGMPRHCTCTGNDQYQSYKFDLLHTSFHLCKYAGSYLKIYNEFFHHDGEHGEQPTCRTHHTDSFKDNDPCRCGDVSSMTNPGTQAPTTASTTITTTTTPSPTTTTTTTSAPTTTITKHVYACQSSATILDIATAQHVTNSLANPCDVSGSDEALALTECSLPAPSTWKKGSNILSDCESGSPTIPKYVPIATFTGDAYVSAGSHSGIFIGCRGSGFQAVIQSCGQAPSVTNITATSDSASYYVIV